MAKSIPRSDSLKTIPPQKLTRALQQTVKDCQTCSVTNPSLEGVCDNCRMINVALNRYAESNIPLRYWKLNMKDFKGDPVLAKKYEEIVADLEKTYTDGTSICLAGKWGVGKTYIVTSILKKAVQKGYGCLYTTLPDIVNCIVSNTEDKYVARRELMMIDFLVIDEFDPRHISDSGADLYGRLLEDIFRKRAENKMPTFMCTNSSNVVEECFDGPLKQSMSSLMNYVEIIPVLGQDFRKTMK